MSLVQLTFHWADYLVFVLFLVISVGIGVFHGYRGKKNQTTKDFLMGGGDVNYFAVALSMQASFLSAIFVLGTPSEVYFYGLRYVLIILAYIIGLPIAGYIYLPIFYNLKLTSAYEYLERRFSKSVRTCGSIIYSLMVILYMAVVLYAPSLALSQVTGLSLTGSIIGVGAVCTFYTALGGMKATIWNDAFQMCIVLLGLTLLAILGSVKVGGLGKAWEIATEAGRINFEPAETFSLDFTIRLTFWSQMIGATGLHIVLYGTNQTIIQKFNSIGTLKNAQKSVWLVVCTSSLFMVIICMIGVLMFAYFAECDPKAQGRVDKNDQLMPLFVMEVFQGLPGLPGLFLATAFSAALSSLSGGLNSLAAVFLEDFIKPVYFFKTKNYIGEKSGTILSKILAALFGLLNIGLAFLTGVLGSGVLQIAVGIFGMVGGPLTGVLTCGILLPWVNTWGALAGLFTSLGLTCWLAMGTIIEGVAGPTLITRTDGCPANDSISTISSLITDYTTQNDISTTASPAVYEFYKVSYMWYPGFAIVVCVVVAMVVSFLTGYQKPDELQPGLVFSFSDNCCCCCSEGCKKCCRCGVKEQEDDVEVMKVLDKGTVLSVMTVSQDEKIDNIHINDGYHQSNGSINNNEKVTLSDSVKDPENSIENTHM